MSAPQIPNLLSLRGSRGGARGRLGRGRAGQSTTTGPVHDATVQGTDTDAAVSRLSAVGLGYLDDPYAQYFVQAIGGPPARRLPIINRGTYTRTTGLDALVNSFLSPVDLDPQAAPSPKQIVSLGAGTDTRPFRIFAEGNHHGLVYHEVDFEVVCNRKLRTVQGNPRLASILTDLSSDEGSTTWSSRPATGGEYHCHGLDLRRLLESSEDPLIPGLRADIPTLVLSECCLCYLSPDEARGVVAFFTSRITSLATVIYEPIRPHDAFGQVMVSNLAARKLRMPTLEVYREARDQEDRLSQAGFETVHHMTIEDIWKTWVAPEEKERLDTLEGLDEVEEWQLLAAHYVVVWASKGEGFDQWNNYTERRA